MLYKTFDTKISAVKLVANMPYDLYVCLKVANVDYHTKTLQGHTTRIMWLSWKHNIYHVKRYTVKFLLLNIDQVVQQKLKSTCFAQFNNSVCIMHRNRNHR